MVYLDVCKGLNHIGRLGEHEHRTLRFWDSANILAMYPEATVTVLHKRPGDAQAYPVAPGYVEIQDGIVLWTIQSGDLARVGKGQVELVFHNGNTIAKSIIFDTFIDRALDGAGDPPEPWESWIDEVTDAADRAEAAAELLENPGATAETLSAGSEATASYSDGTFHFGIPRGQQGGKGDPGDDYVITEEDYDEIAEAVVESQGLQRIVDDATDYANIAHKLVDGKDLDGNPDAQYSENNADYFAGQAKDAAEAAEGSKVAAAQAKDDAVAAKNAAEAATVHQPIIGQNGNWFIWDQQTQAYVDSEEPSGSAAVQDVQVNGTSVVTNGVANVPLASFGGSPGAVKLVAGNGIGLSGANNLMITTAIANAIKNGTNTYMPITPYNQHESIFYGLAKLAGADLASSSNTVGVYPDNAKVAIQKMLGIYEAPWELIREDEVTNATEADIEITVDGNGQAFELTDVYLQVWTPRQETGASIGDYGTVRNYYGDSGFIASQMQTWEQAPGASAKYGQVLLKNENGAVINVVTQNNSQYALIGLTGRTNMIANDALVKIGTYTFKKTVIKKVTGTINYRLYGRRKWN